MHELSAGLHLIHENLDTSYVNLGALIRYLQERNFTGHIQVELDEYSAEIFLQAELSPRVREKDHFSRREAEGEAALQRLLVRAREPGGSINVYQGKGEPRDDRSTQAAGEAANPGLYARPALTPGGAAGATSDVSEIVVVSGELIAAVERAAQSTGCDFAASFRAARLMMADDFPFLDPLAGRFTYRDGAARLRAPVSDAVLAAGISELLRRTVESLVAARQGGQSSDERRRTIGRELAVVARRRMSALSRYNLLEQLDQIAGTRVL